MERKLRDDAFGFSLPGMAKCKHGQSFFCGACNDDHELVYTVTAHRAAVAKAVATEQAACVAECMAVFDRVWLAKEIDPSPAEECAQRIQARAMGEGELSKT